MRTKIEILLSIIIFSFIINSSYKIFKKISKDNFIQKNITFELPLLDYDTIYAQTSSVFSLAVYPNSVDFGDMWPGSAKTNFPSGGTISRVVTQYPDDWQLKIHVVQPLCRQSPCSDINIIPLSNFQFCSTGGEGLHPDASQDNLCPNYSTFATAPTKFYDAHDNESPNWPTGSVIRTKLKLTMPNNQRPGYYFTTIIFTLAPEI